MGDIVNVQRFGKEPTELIDPHCVPVVPGHDLQVHTLPNGNLILTTLTYQFDPEGQLVAVVTTRTEWTPEVLMAVRRKVAYVLEAGELAGMEPANVLAS